MTLSVSKRPSPAVLLAAAAMCFALVGTAVAANPVAKLTKKKVAAIAKQEIDKAASGLSVSKAKTADSATNAANAAALGGVPAASYLDSITLSAAVADPPLPGFDSVNQKEAVAACPAGTVAIGASAVVAPPVNATVADKLAVNREVAITDSVRVGDAQWRVNASETDDIAVTWHLSVQAVCVG